MIVNMRVWRMTLAAGVLLTGVAPGIACCGVAQRAQAVAFGDQTNIVVWDAVNRLEHFVRNARFRSNASNFGFIAPTPSKPELSEASSDSFVTLARLQPVPFSLSCSGPYAGAQEAKVGDVQVIQQADVAGYRATTLLASDARALAEWMTQNGYATTPAVETWTKFYIAKNWYLTAFKVLDMAQVASTGTIRMSFKTDRPFNPFYVPSDNIMPGQKGTLKLYFVSNGDYSASIGGNQGWRSPEWSASLSDDATADLSRQLRLAGGGIPPGAQVEAFVDKDFPRAAPDDIYFTRQRPNWWLDLLGFAALGGAGILGWRRVSRGR